MINATRRLEFWENFSAVYSDARSLPISDIFNSPASEASILEAEAHVGFRLPDDVRAAYSCFDGQNRLKRVNGRDTLSDFFIFPSVHYLHSLSEALSTWDMYRQMEDKDYGPYSRYDANGELESAGWRTDLEGGYEIMPPTWGPVTHWPVIFDRKRFPLSVWGHATIWVDMNPRERGKIGQVLECVITDSCTWVAPSLEAHCKRLCELIESKDIFWGELGWTYTATGERLIRPFIFDEAQ